MEIDVLQDVQLAELSMPAKDFVLDTHHGRIRLFIVRRIALPAQASADSAYTWESCGLPDMAQSSPASTTSISLPDARRTTG